jgi:hypothetical protein
MWDHIKRNIPKTLKNRSSLEYENSESMMTYIYIYIHIKRCLALETKVRQRILVEKPGGTLFQLQALKRDPHAALTKKKAIKCCEGCPKSTSSVALP